MIDELTGVSGNSYVQNANSNRPEQVEQQQEEQTIIQSEQPETPPLTPEEQQEYADALTQAEQASDETPSFNQQSFTEGIKNFFSTLADCIENIFNPAGKTDQAPEEKPETQEVQPQSKYDEVYNGLQSDQARKTLERYKEVEGSEYAPLENGGFVVGIPHSNDSNEKGYVAYDKDGNLANIQNVDLATLSNLSEVGESRIAGLNKNKAAAGATYSYKNGGIYAKFSNGAEREVLSDGSMSYINYGKGESQNPDVQNIVYFGESGNPEQDKQVVVRGTHNGKPYATTKFNGDNYVFAEIGTDGKVHYVDGGGTPVTGLTEAQKEVLKATLLGDDKSNVPDYTPANGEKTNKYTRNKFGNKNKNTQTQQTQAQQTQTQDVYVPNKDADSSGVSTGIFGGQYEASSMNINNTQVYAVISDNMVYYVDKNGKGVTGLTAEQKQALKDALGDKAKNLADAN